MQSLLIQCIAWLFSTPFQAFPVPNSTIHSQIYYGTEVIRNGEFEIFFLKSELRKSITNLSKIYQVAVDKIFFYTR